MKRTSIAQQEKRMTKMLGRALAIALAAPAVFVSAQGCTGDLAPTGDGGADAKDGGACSPSVVGESSDDSTGCTGNLVRLACGLPSGVTVRGNCYFALKDCLTLCGMQTLSCEYSDCDGGPSTDDEGGVAIECNTSCPPVAGRRPEGMVSLQGQPLSMPVGDLFAEAAHLEAASVHAFRILKRELAELGAPDDLLVAAERARRDEIRHARTTATIAKMHGGTPARARVRKARTRTLEEIAIENMIEGCVRETFGALVASWQAEHARDATIASAMKEIAVDEARHAALAWSVAAWAESKMDAEANERVQAAKAKALRDLEREVANDPPRELVSVAGLPSAATQKTMLAALFAGSLIAA